MKHDRQTYAYINCLCILLIVHLLLVIKFIWSHVNINNNNKITPLREKLMNLKSTSKEMAALSDTKLTIKESQSGW